MTVVPTFNLDPAFREHADALLPPAKSHRIRTEGFTFERDHGSLTVAYQYGAGHWFDRIEIIARSGGRYSLIRNKRFIDTFDRTHLLMALRGYRRDAAIALADWRAFTDGEL